MAKHDEYRINAMDAVRLAPRREHWCQEDPLARVGGEMATAVMTFAIAGVGPVCVALLLLL
jgi:hypothetical protein